MKKQNISTHHTECYLLQADCNVHGKKKNQYIWTFLLSTLSYAWTKKNRVNNKPFYWSNHPHHAVQLQAIHDII